MDETLFRHHHGINSLGLLFLRRRRDVEQSQEPNTGLTNRKHNKMPKGLFGSHLLEPPRQMVEELNFRPKNSFLVDFMLDWMSFRS